MTPRGCTRCADRRLAIKRLVVQMQNAERAGRTVGDLPERAQTERGYIAACAAEGHRPTVPMRAAIP